MEQLNRLISSLWFWCHENCWQLESCARYLDERTCRTIQRIRFDSPNHNHNDISVAAWQINHCWSLLDKWFPSNSKFTRRFWLFGCDGTCSSHQDVAVCLPTCRHVVVHAVTELLAVLAVAQLNDSDWSLSHWRHSLHIYLPRQLGPTIFWINH